MIEVHDLTKTYGARTAVDHASFTVRPGVVTGFLGPNGAGKSTTMRAILGLDRPDTGTILVDGHRYADLAAPLATIGAMLDARAVDRRRTARDHLRVLGATIGVGRRRVEEVLATVGLTSVAHRAAGSFSLGMSQRLGIASALLADSGILMLDEPANGLDPDGILWLRQLLVELAAEGRTVLLSSHLMSEMELVADHLLVIGAGRIIADTPMRELVAGAARTHVEVDSPDAEPLAEIVVTVPDATVTRTSAHVLEITGVPAAWIGEAAARHRIRLHGLRTVSATLEEAYMELTHDSVGYRGTTASPALEGAAR
ncbi:ATP-binding cassette domain-containing protein [Sanguibacter sp. HDW7]|uniref:ATP-binding cassette domain-containing protein n=1 Tax=Sanguibacter sp. HDW7 TaxID=2714931 RepID=UPI00140765D2|nr:ATP-binding cassette domain-containing protein [Sanguibacter sp. HDW7]QIK83786.1 ATP-binding cassette domain-containing protein [Sanguibacter sp. HDW7]